VGGGVQTALQVMIDTIERHAPVKNKRRLHFEIQTLRPVVPVSRFLSSTLLDMIHPQPNCHSACLDFPAFQHNTTVAAIVYASGLTTECTA
jgi:hypothetical protein